MEIDILRNLGHIFTRCCDKMLHTGRDVAHEPTGCCSILFFCVRCGVKILTFATVMKTSDAKTTCGLVLLLLCLLLPQDGRGQVSADTVKVCAEKHATVSLRTNLLLPLLNVGAELPLGNRWSVGADWYYPWAFRSQSHKNCYQMDGLNIEGRYWLGSEHGKGEENRAHRLLGHAAGLFMMGGRYDLEQGYSGHQGEYVVGGVDYLYAKPIFHGRMHLELSVGIGYFYSRATAYDVFQRGGKGYRDSNFRKVYQYFGPAKANVSVVVPLRWRTHKQADR